MQFWDKNVIEDKITFANIVPFVSSNFHTPWELKKKFSWFPISKSPQKILGHAQLSPLEEYEAY